MVLFSVQYYLCIKNNTNQLLKNKNKKTWMMDRKDVY